MADFVSISRTAGNSTLSTPVDDPSTHRDVMLQQILVPLVFGVIFLVGVVGNSTLVYIVLRHKKLHNAPNIFIVSLALGDLLLILVSVPFSATVFTFISWPYGQAVCKLNEFLQTLSLGVSVFTLTALAGDRYMAIVYPLRRNRTRESSRSVWLAVGIWILSLVLALPDVVASHIEMESNHSHIVYCTPHPSSWGMLYVHTHVLLHFLLYYLVPLTIIGMMYLLMARTLIKSSRNIPGEGQTPRQLQSRKKVARMILGFVVVFALCWLPRHTYLMWYAFVGDRKFTIFWLVTKIAGFCLAFLNSCLNPLALCFFSKQFSQLFARYLFCCCCPDAGRRTSVLRVDGSQCGTLYHLNNSQQRQHHRNQGLTSSQARTHYG